MTPFYQYQSLYLLRLEFEERLQSIGERFPAVCNIVNKNDHLIGEIDLLAQFNLSRGLLI